MTNNPGKIATSIGSKRTFAGQITNWRRNQQILTILVLLFIAVIFWIIVSLFSSQKDTKVDPALTNMAKPLSPIIDSAVFDDLETRRSFSDEELADFPIMIEVSEEKGVKKIVPLGTTTTPRTMPTPTPNPTTRPSLVDDEEAS